MRKQTKLVAVLSASALLALGASMTSYAAGWTEENGTWVYYDNDGYQVTDEWKRSGNYWFWLNSDGEMATNELIEDDGDYYYVDSNGAMVTNRWIQLENEDPGENDSEYVWYYFQNNGKAYTASDNGVSFKTINGKKYTFDEEGQMLWGWVTDQAERVTDDADWADGLYYCGTADDGAQVTGWAKLHVVDEDANDRTHGYSDDEDQDYWFYFNTNGKKVTADVNDGDQYATKTINGNKYAFDAQGVMVFEWADDFSTESATDGYATAAEWQYFNDREAGNRAKGWFKEVPNEGIDPDAYDDGSAKWFYAKNDGSLYANEIKTINGKKYAFNGKGEMLSGLQAIWFDDKEENKILDAKAIDDESDIDDFVDTAVTKDQTYEIYYFGDGEDGAMKLSSQNVEVDGEVYSFFFVKNGENKGKGFGSANVKDSYTVYEDDAKVKKTIEDTLVSDDKAVYTHGLKITADSDLRYQAVDIMTGKVYKRSELKEMDPTDTLVLINASGSIMKNKSSVKDGDDYYYSTNKYGVITAVASDKDNLDWTEVTNDEKRVYTNSSVDC